MIVFPQAKINLGLNVVRKRPDGYHDIQSVLVPIPLCDVLEAVVDPSLAPGEVRFTRSGIPVEGAITDDLCMKAIRAVEEVHALPGLRVHLHKAIPTGAGLGGGSSDAAQMLLLLDRALGLRTSKARLYEWAARAGSDCPFFLEPAPQLAEGRGERLTPIPLDLEGTWLMLVNPGVHVSTAEVYRSTTPTGNTVDLPAALARDRSRWQQTVVNVMEGPVARMHPVVGAVKERLLQAGAWYAAMSGSGSTVFGLFAQEPPSLGWPKDHVSWTFSLGH